MAPRWMLLLVTVVGWMAVAGCATPDADPENLAERPWNTPKSWETGLPGGMMDRR